MVPRALPAQSRPGVLLSAHAARRAAAPAERPQLLIIHHRSTTMPKRTRRHARHRPLARNLDPNAARGALGQAFLRALAASFRHDGAKRLRELSEQRPHDYLKLAAALLPKEYRLKAVDLSDMGDAELTRALAMVREAIRQKEQEGGGGPARPQPEG